MSEASPLTDAALVERCRAGDATARAALVRRFQRLVYANAMRAGLDEHAAADVFQTVFSRLLAHLPRLAQAERVRAWVVTTAKREALHQRRLAQRHPSLTRADDAEGESPEDRLADESPLAEDALASLQQLDLLRAGLDSLDQRCRDLLLLLFNDDDAAPVYDEVARCLAMPVGSIGPTRARCLGKLRKLMT